MLKYDEFFVHSTDAEFAALDNTPKARCKYCNKELVFRGHRLGTKVKTSRVRWFETPQCCECPEAKAEREEEVRQARLRQEEKRREDAEQRALELQIEHCHRVAELLRCSGLGQKNYLQSFGNYEETEENSKALATIKGYAQYFDEIFKNSAKDCCNGLFIFGPVGVGKTHLAAAVARLVIEKEEHVAMFSMLRLLEELKLSFNETSFEDLHTNGKEMFHNAMHAKLLVLDDLGKEKPTAWGLSKLYELINYRYENLLPTIITSNHAPEELMQILNPSDSRNGVLVEAVVDRILETCRVVGISGQSYRLRRFSL